MTFQKQLLLIALIFASSRALANLGDTYQQYIDQYAQMHGTPQNDLGLLQRQLQILREDEGEDSQFSQRDSSQQSGVASDLVRGNLNQQLLDQLGVEVLIELSEAARKRDELENPRGWMGSVVSWVSGAAKSVKDLTGFSMSTGNRSEFDPVLISEAVIAHLISTLINADLSSPESVQKALASAHLLNLSKTHFFNLEYDARQRAASSTSSEIVSSLYGGAAVFGGVTALRKRASRKLFAGQATRAGAKKTWTFLNYSKEQLIRGLVLAPISISAYSLYVYGARKVTGEYIYPFLGVRPEDPPLAEILERYQVSTDVMRLKLWSRARALEERLGTLTHSTSDQQVEFLNRLKAAVVLYQAVHLLMNGQLGPVESHPNLTITQDGKAVHNGETLAQHALFKSAPKGISLSAVSMSLERSLNAVMKVIGDSATREMLGRFANLVNKISSESYVQVQWGEETPAQASERFFTGISSVGTITSISSLLSNTAGEFSQAANAHQAQLVFNASQDFETAWTEFRIRFGQLGVLAQNRILARIGVEAVKTLGLDQYRAEKPIDHRKLETLFSLLLDLDREVFQKQINAFVESQIGELRAQVPDQAMTDEVVNEHRRELRQSAEMDMTMLSSRVTGLILMETLFAEDLGDAIVQRPFFIRASNESEVEKSAQDWLSLYRGLNAREDARAHSPWIQRVAELAFEHQEQDLPFLRWQDDLISNSDLARRFRNQLEILARAEISSLIAARPADMVALFANLMPEKFVCSLRAFDESQQMRQNFMSFAESNQGVLVGRANLSVLLETFRAQGMQAELELANGSTATVEQLIPGFTQQLTEVMIEGALEHAVPRDTNLANSEWVEQSSKWLGFADSRKALFWGSEEEAPEMNATTAVPIANGESMTRLDAAPGVSAGTVGLSSEEQQLLIWNCPTFSSDPARLRRAADVVVRQPLEQAFDNASRNWMEPFTAMWNITFGSFAELGLTNPFVGTPQ